MLLPNEQDPCQNPATLAISLQGANQNKKTVNYRMKWTSHIKIETNITKKLEIPTTQNCYDDHNEVV